MSMKDYDSYSDDELILRLRDGEHEITDYLMNKYKNLVRHHARSMYMLGADSDDLIQEGMIGLFKALRDYDIGRDASFQTFAELCINRQMYTAVEASRRKKHQPLNSYVSYNSDELATEDETGTYRADPELLSVLASLSDKSPEDAWIDRENFEILEKKIEERLSAFERSVLDLYLTGMGYAQIAKILGRDEKSTDNALQRIKKKLR